MPRLRHAHLLEAKKASVIRQQGICGVIFIGYFLLCGCITSHDTKPFL